MSRRKTESRRARPSHLLAAALGAAALAMTLGACSDVYSGVYLDHRDAIALGAGDAIAANEAAQTIDPWPRRSGNPNLPANGQRMQSAVEHYRTNTVVPPVDPIQLESANVSPPAAQNNSQTQNTPATAVPSIAPGTTTTTTTVVTAAPSSSQ